MLESLEKELARSSGAASVPPVVVQLDKFRIMSDTEVPPEDFLMRLFGKPCFPRRDLSTITGTEKCGKTFFSSMLMACCAQRNVLELERIREEPLKVMWYDTEQSRQSTKSILTDRVYRMIEGKGGQVESPLSLADSADNAERAARCEEVSQLDNSQLDISAVSAISARQSQESNFLVFNVRACTCQERMDYLVAGIEAYKPDMVIVDNVSDLLPSINDPEGSTKVIDQLMQLSTENDCNITIVIHLNRSGEKRNLRGWLGTEILHKAFDVYYCEQIEKTDVFSVEQTFTRKYRIPELLYYKIDENGLPVITAKPNYQPRDANGQYKTNRPEAYLIKSEKADSFNQKYIIRNESNARQPWEWNLRLLFTDTFGMRSSLPLEALQDEVMALSGIQQPKYYEKVFNLAVDQRVVQTTMDRRGRVVAILVPA